MKVDQIWRKVNSLKREQSGVVGDENGFSLWEFLMGVEELQKVCEQINKVRVAVMILV